MTSFLEYENNFCSIWSHIQSLSLKYGELIENLSLKKQNLKDQINIYHYKNEKKILNLKKIMMLCRKEGKINIEQKYLQTLLLMKNLKKNGEIYLEQGMQINKLMNMKSR